jgi:hypothetical protein
MTTECPDCIPDNGELHSALCPINGWRIRLSLLETELLTLQAELYLITTMINQPEETPPMYDPAELLRDELTGLVHLPMLSPERASAVERIRELLTTPNLPDPLVQQARLTIAGSQRSESNTKKGRHKKDMKSASKAFKDQAKRLEAQVKTAGLSPSEGVALTKVAAASRTTAKRFKNRAKDL